MQVNYYKYIFNYYYSIIFSVLITNNCYVSVVAAWGWYVVTMFHYLISSLCNFLKKVVVGQ